MRANPSSKFLRPVLVTLLLAVSSLPSVKAQTLQPSFIGDGVDTAGVGALMEGLAPAMRDSLPGSADASAAGRQAAVVQRWRAAAQTAQAHPSAVDKALRRLQEDSAFFGAAVRGGDTVAVAAFLARLAQRPDLLADELATLPVASRKPVQEAAARLRRTAEEYDQAASIGSMVQVFAEGNIRGLAAPAEEDGGSESVNTAATGLLGLTIRKQTTIWTASISVASTVDTLRRAFGESLLLPGTGSSLVSGLMAVRSKGRSLHVFTLPRNVGLYLYGSSSKSVWSRNVRDAAGAPITDSSSVTVIGLGGGVFYDVAQTTIGATPVGLTLEVGPAMRSIGGDVSAAQHDSLRASVVGNASERVFWGVEGGPQMTFGSVTGALRIYFFPHRGVEGFSRAQVSAAFSVRGSILEGKF